MNRCNRTARPISWKFTADDLTAVLRISQREQSAVGQQATVSQAT